MSESAEQIYLALASMVSLGVFGGLAFYIMHASQLQRAELVRGLRCP